MIQGSKTLHFGCTHRPFRAALLRREGKASGRSFTKSSGNYFAKSSFNSFPEVLVKANMPLGCWVQRTSCLHNQRLVKIIQRHIYIRTSTGQNWWNNSQATHQLPLDLKMSAFASSSSSSSVCGKSSGETKPVPVSNQSWILMFHTKQRHNGRPKYHRPNPFRLSVVLCHLIEKGKRLPSRPAKNISRALCASLKSINSQGGKMWQVHRPSAEKNPAASLCLLAEADMLVRWDLWSGTLYLHGNATRIGFPVREQARSCSFKRSACKWS